MNAPFLLFTLFVYILFLFWLATIVNKRPASTKMASQNTWVYVLSIGVYCTSWTFYGLVGTATTEGWQFLPILLGPILLFILGYPLMQRIASICRQEQLHSITDFIASRYGKLRSIASLTTLIIVIATIPYIALQLKAVSDSFSVMIASSSSENGWIAFLTSIAMMSFALLFGADKNTQGTISQGVLSVIAFESIVKLVAMGSVAMTGVLLLNNDNRSMASIMTSFSFGRFNLDLDFVVETLISALVVLCLPRMFHVCFVENKGAHQLRAARWMFPIYLLLIGLFIIVIALASNVAFNLQSIQSDSLVLLLPMSQGFNFIGIIAFIGGFSAATAMIIIATVTVGKILSNDVVLPIFVNRSNHDELFRYSSLLNWIQRSTIIIIIFLSWLYQQTLGDNVALTSIGLIAFALAVQLSPAIILGIYWRNANAKGAFAGILTGSLLWFYTLMLPTLVKSGLFPNDWLTTDAFALNWLIPEFLFGFDFSSPYARGVIISLCCNSAVIIIVSKLSEQSLLERFQAATFIKDEAIFNQLNPVASQISTEDLHFLLEQFLGGEHSLQIIKNVSDKIVSSDEVQQAEQALAIAVGVVTAKSLINSIRPTHNVRVEDVVSIVDETTKALRFNQDILFASFENMTSAISVANPNFELVAWNRCYEQMFDFPKNYLKIGMTIESIIRFNARRGLLAADEELQVKRRMDNLVRGTPYKATRQHRGDITIEIQGTPLPNGGYVTTYNDISEFIRNQKEIEEARDMLEIRVHERTKTIEKINDSLTVEIDKRKKTERQLLIAKAEAEEANRDKSKLLALASHDLLQPLNAANLFASSLNSEDPSERQTIQALINSIDATETIISTLLEIANLDSGELKPSYSRFNINKILNPLIGEYEAQHNIKQRLRYVKSSAIVLADSNYLRRILQNFISNAVKYSTGDILIGCRHRASHLQIGVYDQGSGIAEQDLVKIFDDFYRGSQQSSKDGLGLGLAVAQRFSRLMGCDIKVLSEVGKGSTFIVEVPLADQEDEQIVDPSPLELHSSNLTIVCIDDNKQNLIALDKFLQQWKYTTHLLSTVEQALEFANNTDTPDVVLMDYQLNSEGFDGIALASKMRDIWNEPELPVCIVTAVPIENLSDITKRENMGLLKKPLRPNKLKSWIFQSTNPLANQLRYK